MTDAEREALATAMRLAFADADGCGQARMRAALAVAEPVLRENEREAASARVLDTAAPAYLDATQGGWWAEFAPMFAESARGVA